MQIRADENGRPVTPTKPETREKLRALLNDKQLREELAMGPAPASPAAPAATVPKEIVDGVYSALSSVLMMVSERWYPNLPTAERERILRFSEPELEQLRPSSARIIAKYSGLLLAKYGDEVALGTVLIGVIGVKMAQLRGHAADHAAAGQQPKNPVTH